MAGVAAECLINVPRLPFQGKPRIAIILTLFGLLRLRQDSHRAFVAAVSAFDGERRGVHLAIIRQHRPIQPSPRCTTSYVPRARGFVSFGQVARWIAMPRYRFPRPLPSAFM